MANPTEMRLARLLAYFENGAAAVRATLAFLAHDPTTSRRVNGNSNGHPMMLDALALDEHRASKSGKKSGLKPGSPPRGGRRATPGSHVSRIRAQRERTAEMLARFDTSTPRTPAELGLTGRIMTGSVVRRGYLKKKAGGYVRTGKPYYVDPKATATQ